MTTTATPAGWRTTRHRGVFRATPDEVRDSVRGAEVKFELLTDLPDVRAQEVVAFSETPELGAVNLRGTGVATQDVEVRTLRAKNGGVWREAEMPPSSTAGQSHRRIYGTNGTDHSTGAFAAG